MKQLSSSGLNNLSKQDLIAMMLQMQQQMNTLTEKMAIANARFFGRSTEKLSTLTGQSVRWICCATALPRLLW